MTSIDAKGRKTEYSFEQAQRKIVSDLLHEALRKTPATTSEEAFAIVDCMMTGLHDKIVKFQEDVNADLERRYREEAR